MRERRLDERSGHRAEDRSVPSVRHDPQRRRRDRAIHLQRELDRVERIAIACTISVRAAIVANSGGVNAMSS